MTAQVSVLMAVYRNEVPAYFRKAIQSMLDQTVPPQEMVIVADGPLTPALEVVLTTYQQQYPQLFSIYHLAKNHGLAYALAYGLQRCKYNLVARMDADDIAAPQRLAWSLQAMQQGDYDIYGGQTAEFDGDETNIVAYRNVPLHQDEIVKFAHRRNPMNHMSVMYKRIKFSSSVITALLMVLKITTYGCGPLKPAITLAMMNISLSMCGLGKT